VRALLVLDEATSALDRELELAIQEQLEPDGTHDRDRNRSPAINELTIRDVFC